MGFCCNVLQNLGMVFIDVTFLGNKFSFTLDLYFMRYMYANRKNETQALNP